MAGTGIELTRTNGGASLAFAGTTLITDLGIGLSLEGHWLWSCDGSLPLATVSEDSGNDLLGGYTASVLTYADAAGPLVQLQLKIYDGASCLVAETTALRDLTGTAVADSFFHTTFNSPVVRLAQGLRYLTYTWGLEGGEGTGIGGYFPDAAIAPDLAALPEQLRLSGFSPNADIHQTGEKPFGPLVAYDAQERTLVLSPLNHFLISPLRLIDTPNGTGVARGLHGAVDFIPAGTTTRTALVFGQGLAATMQRWGDLLLRLGQGTRGKGQESPLVKSLGFWNCYGGYYADLFRPTGATTLQQLARYFREADLPVRYFGLDLWYQFDRVGFARKYAPHPEKYPQGLKPVFEETGLPYLLHMSAFQLENEHRDAYDFVVDEGSSYPAGPEFYQDRAREFKEWGALGIWPDFLRTQLQNSKSLRDRIGAADQWFDGLCRAMGREDLLVMLCMPTIGHYLASAAHDNVIAVRTSTDYVNHQPGQLAALGTYLDEYRTPNSPQRNLRQNLFLSFLAHAVGLAPSHDVFISNPQHPEGFADPNARREALARALSAGIVGIGDQAGQADKETVDQLAFPDGTLAQPDHPPFPVVATLQAEAPAFHTTTTIGDLRWTYLAVFNLTDAEQEYQLDLAPFLESANHLVYDYRAGQFLSHSPLAGQLQPDDYRYLVLPPQVGELHLLGFLDKYVPVSRRQVKGVTPTTEGVTIDLELPAGRSYTFVVRGSNGLQATGQGLEVLGVGRREGLAYIGLGVEAERCRLQLRS
ncbi:MAG: hypothetical protein ACE5Q6_13085 [Dehalococcoidia bacterium]